MKLDPNTLTAIAISLSGMIYLWRQDDPRAWDWMRTQWSRIAGTFRAKRTKGLAS